MPLLCKYWPSDDDIECSGVCYCGSEIGGTPCTQEEQRKCPYAQAEEEADKVIRRTRDE